MLIILVIILLIFGASRLPEIGKGVGMGIKNFKASVTTKDPVDEGTSKHS
jgi:sec-independent protein translocase protein TatA